MNSAVLNQNEIVTTDSGVSVSRSALSKLSRAEARVALLVADGLTNRQIGERLYVSPRTIDSHVANMFNKLNVSSRVRLALAIAA
jgi:DNA-binding NarL/FixJ family response regulator